MSTTTCAGFYSGLCARARIIAARLHHLEQELPCDNHSRGNQCWDNDCIGSNMPGMTSRPPSPTRSSARKRSASSFYDGRSCATDTSYGYLLRRLYASMQRHFDKRMQPLDLTAMQWGPLLLMAEGRGNTAAELARGMDIDTGAMTRMLDRLEAKGLVARARSASDRRMVRLELTAEGLNVASQIPQQLADVLNLHLRGFKADELRLLMSFLERMLANGTGRLSDSQDAG